MKIAICGLLGLLVSFSVYWYGLVGISRSDHEWFIGERAQVASDWEYLVNMLSFNRTRRNAPGDTTLFRPGHTGLLALQDIFLSSKPYWIGGLSLVMHAFVSVLVFAVLRTVLGIPISLAISLHFSVQYLGTVMILWRHISPYMLNCFFVLFGTYILLNSKKSLSRIQIFGVGLCFLFSTFFHEVSIAWLVLLSLLSWLGVFRQSHLSWKGGVGAFLLPVLGYEALNCLSSWIYKTPVLPTAEGLNPALWLHQFNSVIRLGGLFVFMFISNTSEITFQNTTGSERDLWVYRMLTVEQVTLPSLHGETYYWLGISLLGLLFVSIYRVWHKPTQGSLGTLLLSLYFWVISAGLYLGRVATGGANYLERSSYYIYFSNLTLSLLLGFSLSELVPLGIRWKRLSASMAVFIGICLLIRTGSNFLKIQEITGPKSTVEVASAEVTSGTHQAFEIHKGLCLGAIPDAPLNKIVKELWFYRISCRAREGRPVYLRETVRGIGLSRQRTGMAKLEVPLSFPRYIAWKNTTGG